MPRVARKKGAFLAHHVVHRGINRQPIFRDDYDRRTFLRLLVDSAAIFGLSVWSYCLMTNHFHLFVDDPHAHLSEMLHRLNGMYTSKFNLRHRCEGALLRGRFFSKPAFTDDYKLALFRYIHMNPVHAGMVCSPERYRWSSYNDFFVAPEPGLVHTRPILQLLGDLGVTPIKLSTWMQDGASPYLMHANNLRVLNKFVRCKVEGESCAALVPCEPQPIPAYADTAKFTCTKNSLEQAQATLAGIASRHALHVEDIVRASRSNTGAPILARAEALLACRYDVGLCRAEIASLFGIATGSVGPALVRAKAYLRKTKTGPSAVGAGGGLGLG